MHAENSATLGTRPRVSCVGNELLYADCLDTLQICDRTYPILGSIAMIEMPQFRAGKLGAGKAKLMATGGEMLTVFDSASDAGIRLIVIISSTSRTRTAVANVRTAQATM